MATKRTNSKGSPDSMEWTWRSSSGQTGTLRGGQRSVVGDAPDADGDHIVGVTAGADLDADWSVSIALSFDGGSALVESIEFRPRGGPVPALDSKTLDRFKLAGLQRQIQRQLPLVLGLVPPGVEAPKFTPPQPGRGGYPIEQYALWARQYVEAVDAHPTRPIAALVEQHPGTNASSWRRWMDRAETLGLLVDRPAGSEGRAGGRLSTEAKRILKTTGGN